MKVWIDLSNSPHPLLFAPVSKQLQALDHEVRVTARDNAQTVDLARQHWADLEVIGGASPPGLAAKAGSMLARMRGLVSWARRERPDIALSHNSYAQVAAARALGIRTVTAMDYEHQPANHLAFRLAHSVLLPSALAANGVRRMGATPEKARFYEGLKEEIYLGDFTPDRQVMAAAGLAPDPRKILVVARTPPSGALYHRGGNPLFVDALRAVAAQPGVQLVVLPRRPDQRHEIAAWGLQNLALPERALEARSLMYAADLVLGAGGTMTREAALLGVPTLSLFAGEVPAVDRWLEERGDLRRARSIKDVLPARKRAIEPRHPSDLRARGDRVAAEFVAGVLAASPMERTANGR